jgi:hypothetical protein
MRPAPHATPPPLSPRQYRQVCQFQSLKLTKRMKLTGGDRGYNFCSDGTCGTRRSLHPTVRCAADWPPTLQKMRLRPRQLGASTPHLDDVSAARSHHPF